MFHGEDYACERDDEHDGKKQMHAAMIEGEYTNWSDNWPNAGRAASESSRGDV